jgi:hypothetical protein
MGYDADEESGVTMTYQLSNTVKSTCDTLEDENDYQGIIATLQAGCADLMPMYVMSLPPIITAHLFVQKDTTEPKKSKKKLQKELEIAKAKATAAT